MSQFCLKIPLFDSFSFAQLLIFYRARHGISSIPCCPSMPLLIGSYCTEHTFSSCGFSTSLEATPLLPLDLPNRWRPCKITIQLRSGKEIGQVARCLSVRYDGLQKISLQRLATGLTIDLKAFPVPGHLAGSQPDPNT